VYRAPFDQTEGADMARLVTEELELIDPTTGQLLMIMLDEVRLEATWDAEYEEVDFDGPIEINGRLLTSSTFDRMLEAIILHTVRTEYQEPRIASRWNDRVQVADDSAGPTFSPAAEWGLTKRDLL
jgi:hypothetical protein